MENHYILSILLGIPFIGALCVLLLPKGKESLIRWVGLLFSTAAFAVSMVVLAKFDKNFALFQLVDQIPWIPNIRVFYVVGVDGISLPLVLLTTFLTPITMFSSWKSINKKVKEFTFFMLLLEVGMIGVFLALDLFVFYIFWEFMLIPMYFIIGIWGGEQRIYASLKFFIYTMAGSLLMLVAIIWTGFYAGSQVGGFTTLLSHFYAAGPTIPMDVQKWLFLAFTVSFAIKVPLFPFHTWLPDAHVQAPTAGSVILAGVLLKMGTYGLIRFSIPVFPQAAQLFAPWISALAVIGIIYGALVAMVQKDMKKLVAYSSVAHLGFVVLGIFSLTVEGMQGAVIQMVNHGLSTGALFLLVGVVYERTHTREISAYGGIARITPVYATLLLIVSLSSIGLPGLNGFVGEFLILLGSFQSGLLNSWAFSIIAASGVIFAAVYLLWMYQRVVFGPVKNEKLLQLKDMTTGEIATVGLLLIFIVWIGVYPSTFLNWSDASVNLFVNRFFKILVIH
jgi:NADH-quinone oxidoreductase subunit M